jgi:putative transposase
MITISTTVHYGRAETVIAARQEILQVAYAAHPERFVHKPPTPQPLPEAVWINPPGKDEEQSLKPLH